MPRNHPPNGNEFAPTISYCPSATGSEYDLVVVTELPDDETAAKLALGTAMQGNVRTMTMRAFGREEMDKIIEGLM